MKAAWTPEQVKMLNEHQQKGVYHPYTCTGTPIECLRDRAYQRRRQGQKVEYTSENEGILKATENGWICPCGKYKQDWAHG